MRNFAEFHRPVPVTGTWGTHAAVSPIRRALRTLGAEIETFAQGTWIDGHGVLLYAGDDDRVPVMITDGSVIALLRPQVQISPFSDARVLIRARIPIGGP